MKRIIKLTIMLLVLLMPATANAYHFEVNGIYYNITSSTNKTVEVTYYNYYNNTYSGSVSIPRSVTDNGITYTVTAIGERAFHYSDLTNVTIPNTVTTIGYGAFRGCFLSKINLPNTINSIANEAFSCCWELTSITIPDLVTSIGYETFYKCSKLKSVIIGNSVTTIGSSAFSGCSMLSTLSIGNSVTNIDGDAFSDCSNLSTLTIPKSVKSIATGAFSNCSGLTKITVDNENSYYDSRSNCNAIIDRLSNTLIVGCKNTTIPNTVKSIGLSAFEGCSGLTSITIPNSVTSIGESAFYGCSGLTNINIPNSVITLGKKAFSTCNAISIITVANDNPNYDSRDNCNAIIETSSNTLIIGCKNTSIPYSVTTIGASAFYGCSSLTSVVIPNSVTTIGTSAFEYCRGLTSVVIPNSVTTIGTSAFEYCRGLTSIVISNSLKTLEESVFSGCSGLTSVIIPNSVTTIDKYAFYGCSSLTSIEIPNSVTTIRYEAFHDCSSLTSIEIPNSVTTIGASAFYGCSSLTSIAFGRSVSSIGDYAFYSNNNESNIESVTCLGRVPPVMEKSTCFNARVYQNAILYVPCESYGVYQNTDYWSKFSHIECFNDISRGDADGSGSVNIDDVTALIDYLLSGNADDVDLTGADAYPDGKINIDDVTALINYLLSGVWADDPVTPEEPETETYTVNGVSFKMVKVKGGSFTMGATFEQDDAYDDEKPTHKVILTDFSIGQTEVTQELWQAVMGENNSAHTGNLQYPTDCVSWNEAQEFITQLNALTGLSFHLPTEAQWEFAARGGIKSMGYKHSGSNSLSEVAWYCENSDDWTHPVGLKKANELGIYDMNGNVWEWTQDWYGEYSSSEQTNPTGPATGSEKVHRGGCFNNDERYSRVSGKRHTYPPSDGSTGEGFRLAMTAPTISLSQTQITVEVGDFKSVDILNGSGSYTCRPSSSNVTCQISGEKLYVTGLYIGSCTITVFDVTTHLSTKLSVTVLPSSGGDSFGVSSTSFTIQVGEQASTNILNGHGSYSCTPSTSCVSCWIDGEKVFMKGISTGTCTVTVKDLVTNATARIYVTVVFTDQTITVNGVSFKMIAINGGTFTMGATSEQSVPMNSDEKPTHEVTLSRYKISQTEVTQELWLAVMSYNPSHFKGEANLPVDQVSWDDCQVFISRLNEMTGMNFRLPTEAEWEYAARGANKSQGYVYAGSDSWTSVAWCGGTAGNKTHPVASKSPNELGLYDMSGNVAEWCSDYYGPYSEESVTNPFGPATGGSRVLRGGCWRLTPSICRVSARENQSPTVKSSDNGLRLVL